MSRLDLHNFRYYLVQEVTVMGYDEYGSGIIQKVIFQPCDALHIQMVGGLVQKKNIRTGEKQLAQGYPRLLSSGKDSHFLAEIFFAESQTLQDSGKLAFVRVAVFQFEFMGETGIGVHQTVQFLAVRVFHFFFDRAHPVFHIQDILFGGEKLFVDRKVALNILVLGQVSDPAVLRKGYSAGI